MSAAAISLLETCSASARINTNHKAPPAVSANARTSPSIRDMRICRLAPFACGESSLRASLTPGPAVGGGPGLATDSQVRAAEDRGACRNCQRLARLENPLRRGFLLANDPNALARVLSQPKRPRFLAHLILIPAQKTRRGCECVAVIERVPEVFNIHFGPWLA